MRAPRVPQHLLLALPLALPPMLLFGAVCEARNEESPPKVPAVQKKASIPAGPATRPASPSSPSPRPSPPSSLQPSSTPSTFSSSSSSSSSSTTCPCDKLNTAAFRTLNWSARRTACNGLPQCTFTGRSVTGHCWTSKDLAEYETSVYLKEKELARRLTKKIENDEERDDNSEFARRSKYFEEASPPIPSSSDVYASILSSDALSQVRSLTIASLSAVPSGETDYHNNPEKVRDL